MTKLSLLQVNVRLLKIWALYPPKPDAHFITVIADKLYKFLCFVSLYSVFLPCAYELYLGEKSKITDYTLNIMNTGVYLCSILTLHFFYTRGKTGRKLVMEMNQYFKHNADVETVTNMEKANKLTRKFTIGFVSLLGSGVVCMALVPLLMAGRILPVPGKYPFNWKETPNYQLVYALQFYAQINIGFITSVSDTFFICVVLLAAEQFKMLASDFHNCLYKALFDVGFVKEEILDFGATLGATEVNVFRSLGQPLKNSRKASTTVTDKTAENINLMEVIQSESFQEKQRKLLISYIKHHQMLLNFCVQTEDFFWPLIFMKVAVSMFYHIFITFAMVSSTDPTMAFTLAQYELCAVAELFIFALAGQTLINESENVREELYKSPWYFSNQQYQKAVIMILMRCDRTARVSVGKLANMSLPTFIMIMKTALSYLAVLRQVTE